MKTKLASILFLSASFAVSACGGAPPPPPAAPMTPTAVVTPAPVAVDHGQPKMEAALNALQRAQAEVNTAEANKGGHREKALGLIQESIDAVHKGMEYANAHPTEEGIADGPAAAEPGRRGSPAPRVASRTWPPASSRSAKPARQLHEAKHDKGGFREQALLLIQGAIDQLKEGIRFANHH